MIGRRKFLLVSGALAIASGFTSNPLWAGVFNSSNRPDKWTRSAFNTHMNQWFHLEDATGKQQAQVQLIAVEDFALVQKQQAKNLDQYSVKFRGTATASPLPPGIYQANGSAHKHFQVYIEPVSGNSDGQQHYAADFCQLV